jgi:uncharacterized membrane protein
MIFLFMFFVYLSFGITFEVFFNAFARLFGWYNLQKDENKYNMVGSCSLYTGIMYAICGLIMFCIYFVPVFNINGKFFHLSFVTLYTLLGGVIITLLELFFGLLFNKKLNLELWDYSKEPFNVEGQISLFRSLGWTGLSFLMWFINTGIIILTT